MFQTNVWCYLWDLVDEGIDGVLDRLKGEAGATGISVATSYYSVDQLRPHAGMLPRTFRSHPPCTSALVSWPKTQLVSLVGLLSMRTPVPAWTTTPALPVGVRPVRKWGRSASVFCTKAGP